MKTIRNINKIGICLSLIIFVFSSIKAWAVVPYETPPEVINAEKVQAEKQEIIKDIEKLEKQDITAIKEIRNELDQIEEKDSNSLLKDKLDEERH